MSAEDDATPPGRFSVLSLFPDSSQSTEKGGPDPPRRPPGVVVAWLAAAGAFACLTALLALNRPALAASLTALRQVRWVWLPLAVLAEAASMLAAARGHLRLLEAGGGRIRLRSVLGVAYAGNAIASTVPFAGVPAAVAYSFRQYRRRGIELPVSGWAFAVSWMIANFSFALVLAAGALTAGNDLVAAAGLATSVLFMLPAVAILLALRYPWARRAVRRATAWVAGRSRRLAGHPRADVAAALDALLARVGTLGLPFRHYAEVFALSLFNWAADVVCLACAIRATGSPVPWHGLLLAYGAGMTAGSLGLTPGGLGVVEAALSAALVAAGMRTGNALAAVAVYRLLSFWLVLAAGWVVLGFMSRRGKGTPELQSLEALEPISTEGSR
ncbi:MAG TPA: lysylphosphatidylglycerol synthase transmembrane domain-containing protein [Actinomycetota bacterium]|nr:lysylphosphatidylglycerol synthase transmembrane domain-containing protein [Actinomycetota bacterium]